jgi:hypothetical protein
VVGLASEKGKGSASRRPPFYDPHRPPVFFLLLNVFATPELLSGCEPAQMAREGRGMTGKAQEQQKAPWEGTVRQRMRSQK